MPTTDIYARIQELQRRRGASTAPTARTTPAVGRGAQEIAVTRENQGGTYGLVQRPLDQLWPGHQAALTAAERDRTGDQLLPEHPELRALAENFPRNCMFLDLETCGFAGSMVFLVGVIHEEGDRLLLSQLLARNYAEEHAMLRALWQIAGGNQVLASFNGKSFDWPCIHDRSTLHHIGAESRTGLIHCDLLHHARRRWKDRLPNCRLQTLERYVCGRRRSGDIPGSEIPMAYHDFVRSGNTRQLESILHHNALDLVTLVELAVRVARKKERGAKNEERGRR